MHKCNENMNAMLVLKVSKHKTYNFQKFLIFLIFEKSGMLQEDLLSHGSLLQSPYETFVIGLAIHPRGIRPLNSCNGRVKSSALGLLSRQWEPGSPVPAVSGPYVSHHRQDPARAS